ncbi:MAG: hypothetical protein HDS13_04170 [Bacteroides sp.]|nr:hypothetical protein [Bacteroides sp.]
MLTFIIIFATIGMLLFPLGRLYSLWQSRKPGNKFANTEYRKNFQSTLRIISLVICGIAILILFIMAHTSS